MKIYEVISKVNGSHHVVVAQNANDAIAMMVNYLNHHSKIYPDQVPTYHFYKTSDFYVAIDVNKISKPTIIN